MNFLVIQHLDIEPPALIGETLENAGHNLSSINLDRGDALPDCNRYDGVIIMGGPQSANDESDYIQREISWVKSVVKEKIPMLGICLGAQIMARAAGANVIPSPLRELGWHPIYHTAAAADDPLFTEMPEGLGVFQWHGESFDLTDQMTLVATHPDVPAQAFRLGSAQYGLQFHVEVDETIIESWIAHGQSERDHLGIEGVALLHRETSLYLDAMQQFCCGMVHNWLKLISR